MAVAWNSGAGRVRKLAMNTSISTPGPGGEVVVYESRDGEARVDVRLDQETVWLTRQMRRVQPRFKNRMHAAHGLPSRN